MKMIPKVLATFGVLLSLTGLDGASAQAPPQEKRLALVVGNANYQKGALPTAANDAGLIAQTLQAAGFDVVGARDLDGETLRRSFRDFIQKVQTSGPDTVAFVYLAGYGMQLTGENYFAPIDANIRRDTDVPVEALRISDYTHQLAALPLRAGVVVLDAARGNPFATEGQPLAGGLALVEPDARMLVAFNAAPGTVGPEGAPPYGAYAQALAEMMRAGGLTLPDVFDRVRLRVNEMTKGAEIPWDAQKIESRFVFFERGPDAPPAASADQIAAQRSKPIRDFDVKDAYIAALERDTLQDYENFLIAFPNDPLARRVRAIVAARREAVTWRRTYRIDTPPAYWSYLTRYPRGPHAWDARRRLTVLSAALAPPPAFAAITYDVAPPPPEEIVYVDRPVLIFDDPTFAFAPPPPPPVFFLPPPPPDFIILPPPPPPIGIFVLPTPLFVAIPAYVSAPAYVVPPPNNIIFANIHNTTVINNVINKTVINNAAPQNGAPKAIGGSGPATAVAPSAAASLPPAAAQKANLVQPQSLQQPRGPAQSGAPGLPQGAVGRPLPGANGKPLPKPALATPSAPIAKPAATVTQPANAPAAAIPAAKIETPALAKPVAVPGAKPLIAPQERRAAITHTPPVASPKVTLTSPPAAKPRPPINTAAASPAKRLPSAQPPKLPPRPVAVRAPPPRPAPKVAAPPRPQQQAQHVVAARPPQRPPVAAKPACRPGANCKH